MRSLRDLSQVPYIFEATVFVINGVANYEPNFEIADNPIARASEGQTYCLAQGYVIDSEATTQENVYTGLRIEHSAVIS